MKRINLLIVVLFFLTELKAQENKIWTLKACVNHALENNISIKQSELDKGNAIQDVTAAKWNFFPNLNANASQSFIYGSTIGVSGARISNNISANNFGVNSSLTLFNGFSNLHSLKQAQIGVEVQDAALQKMRNDVVLNVANAYLQVLFAEEQLRVAEEQVKISEGEVNRTKELVDAGVLPKGDFLNINSVLANDNQNLVIAQNTFSVARLRLGQLLQLEEPFIMVEPVDMTIKEQGVLLNSAKDIYIQASTTMPEIKLAELNIQSAEESIKLAQSNYYPTLTLNYGMNTVYQRLMGDPIPGFDTPSFSNQIDNNLGNTISLSLNVPIFNRFQFKTNVNKSSINQQRIVYSLESEKLRLRETIQMAYTDALAASKAYDAASLSVEAQQEAFNYARERFAAGAINSFDFNQTKNSLVAAESQLIQAKYDFIFKLKVLEFYSGIPIVGN